MQLNVVMENRLFPTQNKTNVLTFPFLVLWSSSLLEYNICETGVSCLESANITMLHYLSLTHTHTHISSHAQHLKTISVAYKRESFIFSFQFLGKRFLFSDRRARRELSSRWAKFSTPSLQVEKCKTTLDLNPLQVNDSTSKIISCKFKIKSNETKNSAKDFWNGTSEIELPTSKMKNY